MTSHSFFNSRHLWLGGIFLATLATGISIYSVVSSSKPNITNNTSAIASAPLPVTALGRLEPEGEVMRLAAPVALDGDRLKELRVQVGDRVKAGQIIAVLDASARFADEVAQAKAQLEIAQAEFARVSAGAKQSEIQAQEASILRLQADLRGSEASQSATISRWQSEVRTAEAELARFQQLYAQGAISASVLDTKRLAAETTRAQLQEALSTRDRFANTLQAQILEASSTRDRIAEVRPVDIVTKAREVDSAIAALKHDGIVELGATDRMVAVLEVYQTEIDRVKVGQSATISGQSFQGEVKGIVSQVGLQVERQRQATNQAGENLDRRVIEVKVRLSPEDSRRVAAFTNLQVQGKIQTTSTN